MNINSLSEALQLEVNEWIETEIFNQLCERTRKNELKRKQKYSAVEELIQNSASFNEYNKKLTESIKKVEDS
jgi:hypothetical protein